MNHPVFNYLFPFFKNLNNGTILRKILATIIRISAFALVCFVIGMSIYAFVEAIKMDLTIGMFFGLVFILLLLVLFSFIAMQIQLYHANEIVNLPNSPFTITPIISIYFRMFGEIYALLIIIVGIILFFLTLFSASGAMDFLPYSGLLPTDIIREFRFGNWSGANIILSSFTILLAAFFSALFVLMSSYLISELLVVITDIAVNVRRLLPKESNQNNQVNSHTTLYQENVQSNAGNSSKIISIGRASDCTIVINDTTVSKMHAEIIFENGNISIRDLGSTNGTFINGNKLNGTQLLQPNDIVKAGNSVVAWQNYI
jgi:hypothetical protein